MGDRKLTLTVFYMDTSDRFCTNECAHEVRPEHICYCVEVRRSGEDRELWAETDCGGCSGRGRRPGTSPARGTRPCCASRRESSGWRRTGSRAPRR